MTNANQALFDRLIVAIGSLKGASYDLGRQHGKTDVPVTHAGGQYREVNTWSIVQAVEDAKNDVADCIVELRKVVA